MSQTPGRAKIEYLSKLPFEELANLPEFDQKDIVFDGDKLMITTARINIGPDRYFVIVGQWINGLISPVLQEMHGLLITKTERRPLTSEELRRYS